MARVPQVMHADPRHAGALDASISAMAPGPGTRPLPSLLPLVAFAIFATFHNRVFDRGIPHPGAQESSGFRISLQRLRRAREFRNQDGRGV